LEAQYEAYRRRQARRLIRLLPREAIRPLYRRALSKVEQFSDAGDPLGVLVEFCETVLPLPPFDVWRDDLLAHPVEHLHELDDSADAPTADTPSTVATRTFSSRGSVWVASLRSFRDEVTWRGYIAFEDQEHGTVQHTAVVFRESDPAELRERFFSFDEAALEAFLRSALP
jgi:hypothetical protein